MKKIILTIGAGLAATTAHLALADTVTIYGLIDTGVEYYNHANAAGDSLFRMPSLTGSNPSRIGFRGTEDLGGGMKAFFVLENGFAPDTGAINYGGRLFGRAANLGLSDSWGAITLGRQLNMTMYSLFDADVIGASIHSMGTIDTYIPHARSDNAVGYMGKFSGFTVGATYSFGRDASAAGGPSATNCGGEVAGDSLACRQYTALLKYDQSQYGVAVAYDELRGNTGAANGLTSSNDKDTRISANGYWKFGDIKVGGGWIGRDTQTPASARTNLYFLGVSYLFSPAFILDAQTLYYGTRYDNGSAKMYIARLTYNLSKRTALYTSLGYVTNKGVSAIPISPAGSAPAGANQLGSMIGIRHSF